MANTTITTHPRLVTVAIEPGKVLNLPRRVPGLDIDTAVAVKRALKFTDGLGLWDELLHNYEMAKGAGLEFEDAERGFIAWMAEAGDWAE